VGVAKFLLLVGFGLLAAIVAARVASSRARASARLHYVEPGMPESDEDVDPAALLTDVGESITPERAD
jgi:hypothetical protein